MIQDLENHCYHNEYQPVPPKGTDCILYFEDRRVLVRLTGDSFSFPAFAEAEKTVPVFTILIHTYFPSTIPAIILPLP